MTNHEEELIELMEKLRDPAPVVRAKAVDRLATLRDPNAVPALVWLMADKSLWVRCNAAEALGEIRTKEAVSPLVSFLKLGTKTELEAVGPPEEDPLRFHRFTRRYDPAYEAWLQEQGLNAVDAGLNLTVSARLALGSLGVVATEALVGLLDDHNPYTRYVARTLLNTMSMRREPLAALTETLQSGTPRARMGAAYALGRLGNFGAVDALASAVDDPDIRVVAAVLDSLGTIRDKRVAPLLAALGRRREEAASMVWAALSALEVDPDTPLDEGGLL